MTADNSIRIASELAERFGANDVPHARKRALSEHLRGTAQLLRDWDQAVRLQIAGALHSVYGTDVFEKAILPIGLRETLRSEIGIDSERLVFLFCAVPRSVLFDMLPADVSTYAVALRDGLGHEVLSRQDLADLLVLHLANLVEQSAAIDGSPGIWLGSATRLISTIESLVPGQLPVFFRFDSFVATSDEIAMRERYGSALDKISEDPLEAVTLFEDVAETFPHLGEARFWLAYLAMRTCDVDFIPDHLMAAAKNFNNWAISWDRRLSIDEWLKCCDLMAETAISGSSRIVVPFLPGNTAEQTFANMRERLRSVEAPGEQRLRRYIDGLADSMQVRGVNYPDLPTKRFFDPQEFGIARELESNFKAILEEFSALNLQSFHREAEPIARSGSWDVLFLYDRGRKNVSNCEACPVTTRIVEGSGTILTHSGLIYFSRLAPHTRVDSHTGPTNIRIRCHLGLKIPKGAVISVGDEERTWTVGKCLVFDDSFVHSAWNDSDEERVVLIVDLWHPSLSQFEQDRLAGLERHVTQKAENLHRYWAANDVARNRRGNDYD